MTNPMHIGLAVAATASLGFAAAHGEGGPKNGPDATGVSELFQEGTMVTYKPGSGIHFKNGDGTHIRLGGRVQPKWYFLALDEGMNNTNSFRVRRTRLFIDGQVNENTDFLVTTEAGGGFALLDAWGRYKFHSGDDSSTSLRIGQGRFMPGRQSDTHSGNLEFVDRSIATRTFATSRATGAAVEGDVAFGDDGAINWMVAAVNNDQARGSSLSGAGATNGYNNKLNYVFGIRVDPQGDMGGLAFAEGDLEHSGEFQSSVGASLTIGNDKPAEGAPAPGNDIDVFQININAAIKTGSGIAAQGEVFIRTEDPDTAGSSKSDSTGWYVQGSYTMEPGEDLQWGFGGRVSGVTLDDAGGTLTPAALEMGQSLAGLVASSGEVLEATAGVNAYYHKHQLKTQFNYTFQQVSPDGGSDMDNHGLELMFTIEF